MLAMQLTMRSADIAANSSPLGEKDIECATVFFYTNKQDRGGGGGGGGDTRESRWSEGNLSTYTSIIIHPAE